MTAPQPDSKYQRARAIRGAILDVLHERGPLTRSAILAVLPPGTVEDDALTGHLSHMGHCGLLEPVGGRWRAVVPSAVGRLPHSLLRVGAWLAHTTSAVSLADAQPYVRGRTEQAARNALERLCEAKLAKRVSLGRYAWHTLHRTIGTGMPFADFGEIVRARNVTEPDYVTEPEPEPEPPTATGRLQSAISTIAGERATVRTRSVATVGTMSVEGESECAALRALLIALLGGGS